MNHRKTAITGLLWLCMFAAGISAAYSGENSSALKATPAQHDFGTVAEGENAVFTAIIENTGTTPVEITNVRTSWACTEAMLGKHALNPNEKTELKVTYLTKGRPGPFEKHVILSTSVPGQEKIEIFAMKGTVKEAPGAKITVSPRRVTLEGNDVNTGKKQAFTITNEGVLPLVIKNIRSRDSNFVYYDGAKSGDIIVEPAQTKTIEIQLKAKEGTAEKEYILIESNAANVGQSGLFLMIQYSAK